MVSHSECILSARSCKSRVRTSTWVMPTHPSMQGKANTIPRKQHPPWDLLQHCTHQQHLLSNSTGQESSRPRWQVGRSRSGQTNDCERGSGSRVDNAYKRGTTQSMSDNRACNHIYSQHASHVLWLMQFQFFCGSAVERFVAGKCTTIQARARMVPEKKYASWWIKDLCENRRLNNPTSCC